VVALHGRLTKFGVFAGDEAVSVVAAVTGHDAAAIRKIIKKAKILADRLTRQSP
jgi:hypothetical protein